MDQQYSKLRFKELAVAAAVGGAVALHATSAVAAPATGSGTGAFTIQAGNAKWFLNNNITFATTSSAWGFSEGSLVTHSGTRNDAFDGALSWHVNSSPPGSLNAGGYVSPSGTIDIAPGYPTNPAVGTTATGATQTLAGLNVTGQLYFSPVKAVVRSMLVLQNPTGAPITVTVDIDSNLGSDANTVYQATSSGDAVFDPTDNWAVTCQKITATPNTCDTTADPILTFAFGQTGAAVRPTTISPFVDGSDKQDLRYTVTVPAGQTRRLVAFEQMSDTVAHAVTDAALFNTNASLQGTDYLSGLTPTQQSEIVNWTALGPIAAPAGIPMLSKWALIAMNGLLGLLGLGSAWAVGRRRRSP